MKGKIPITAEMFLESSEDHWRLLVNGFVNHIQTSGIIVISPERKVRVQLHISHIIPPENSSTKTISRVSTSLEKEISSGMERISNSLSNKIEKTKWIFIGEVTGGARTPVIIIYYEFLNIFFYSQKLKEEKNSKFLPNFSQN